MSLSFRSLVCDHDSIFVHLVVVDCGPPSDPDNGDVSVGFTTFGSIAAYMCNSGYVLSSASFIRSCQGDGEWSGADPTCDRELSACQRI